MIDLTDLEGICGGLSPQSAGPLAHRAAVALERRHAPGVSLRVGGDVETEHELRWAPRSPQVAVAEDLNEATRDGAMGIALALASRDRNWHVVRRLQSTLSEGADWLMRDEVGVRFALEVKGTDEGHLPRSEAVKQARASSSVRRGAVAAACVVRFLEPRAVFHADEPR